MVLPLSAVIGERAKRAKLAVRVSMVLEFWCVFNPPCGCVYARLVVDVVLKHSRWFRSKSDGRDLMRFDAAELLMMILRSHPFAAGVRTAVYSGGNNSRRSHFPVCRSWADGGDANPLFPQECGPRRGW